MERLYVNQRNNWKKIVEKQGLIFHTTEVSVIDNPGDFRHAPSFHKEEQTVDYWEEGTYYRFSMNEINEIEKATNELHARCLDAAGWVIDNKQYHRFGINDDSAIYLIEKSWNEEPPAIYGRFDLALDGAGGAPKMLEYNADTPTSLLEAAVVQWFWLQDVFPKLDQFNSIHERLIAKWKELRNYLKGKKLYFTYVPTLEDTMTIGYMRDVAEQAGIKTEQIEIFDVGWDWDNSKFVDLKNKPMDSIFKLYPWEWMIKEEFGKQLLTAPETQWIEPTWKMLLSNKAILPILWELFPNHPNLLPSWANEPKCDEWVKKPILGREGANVEIHSFTGDAKTEGVYGAEGYIYQKYVELKSFGGYRPVIGSWVIDGESAGMGIRECIGKVTNNLSQFVPHVIYG